MPDLSHDVTCCESTGDHRDPLVAAPLTATSDDTLRRAVAVALAAVADLAKLLDDGTGGEVVIMTTAAGIRALGRCGCVLGAYVSRDEGRARATAKMRRPARLSAQWSREAMAHEREAACGDVFTTIPVEQALTGRVADESVSAAIDAAILGQAAVR